ncbi:gibberellin 20-oxidase-like protein [Carica papaya]|uniref:gibberellin 20-oxidase-like protein n=1 Tax=Carica papaya TaxID=3649 RepID=UPI000B8CD2DF|nr:gibberellin 20-oxidase-like protein [Carica papaya]
MSSSQTCARLPVFDISQPFTPSSLSSLSQACQQWGFFHIINHGISTHLYRKLYTHSNRLFTLPSHTKCKAGPSSSINTYTPPFIASPFFESLRVSGPDFFSSAQSSAEILVDDSDSEFSEVVEEYGKKMSELSKKIVQAVLMSLGIDFEKKFYETEFRNCHGYLRINNYLPPPSEEKVEEDKIEGLGMHTDMSCVTIVYQNEIGGLQVRSVEGKWMDINPCEETLVVNIGDLMEAWSDGRLRSSEHRVVLKKSVNRFSVAFFWCFEDEKLIYAPSEVVGEENVRRYKPFVCRDYVRFRESSEEGKFEKVGYTVKNFAGIES